MQHQTQTHTFKECNSCRRTIPVEYFGISLKTKGCFNTTCKECRNYRRRKSYRGNAHSHEEILPLNENNIEIIGSSLSENSSVEFPCLELRTNNSLVFRIKKIAGAFQFDLIDSSEDAYHTYYTDKFELFKKTAVIILNERKIRLFKPQDHQALLEWQFNPLHNFVFNKKI